MHNGIAKTYRRDNEVIFVDIFSHNENLQRVAHAINEEFVGQKNLLTKAASIHDLLKGQKLNLKALTEGRGNLFQGHGSEFPDILVDKNFNEIEFDERTRTHNFNNYYILNLIRLHHFPFNNYTLFNKVDFIFDKVRGNYPELREWMVYFIKDWYALKTADWIDSNIMGCVIGGEDSEMGLTSEVELGRAGKDSFNILTPEFLKRNVILEYRSAKYHTKELDSFENSRQLNMNFIERIKDSEPTQVSLNGL